MREVWRNIEGYRYEVSNLGRVRSRTQILKNCLNRGGYFEVTLCRDGECKRFSVHRLVAQAFKENPNNYDTVNHIDKNKLNNASNNLEWISGKNNTRYSHCKAVLQRDWNGLFIKEWYGVIDAHKELNISYQGIINCCKGKQRFAGGFKWQYKEDYEHSCCKGSLRTTKLKGYEKEFKSTQ